jgi:hypothetical protein
VAEVGFLDFKIVGLQGDDNFFALFARYRQVDAFPLLGSMTRTGEKTSQGNRNALDTL